MNSGRRIIAFCSRASRSGATTDASIARVMARSTLFRPFSSKFGPPPKNNMQDAAGINKVKQEAKKMLQNESQEMAQGNLTLDQLQKRIFEVRSMEDLKTKIVESRRPVVMFCMAKWCGTSKQILPYVLSKYAEQWKLWDMSIFDIDSDPKVTSALQIDKVPCVLLVANGDIVDSFKGLVSDREMDAFFNSAKIMGERQAESEGIDQLYGELMQVYERKDWANVVKIANILAKAPLNDSMKRLVRLFEVLGLINSQQITAAKALYNTFSKEDFKPTNDQVKASVEKIEESIVAHFARIEAKQTEGKESLQAEITAAKESGNPESLFAVATKCEEKELFDLCLECLYAIVKKDRNWENKKAFNKYVEVLKNPKVEKHVLKDYRLKLGSIVA